MLSFEVFFCSQPQQWHRGRSVSHQREQHHHPKCGLGPSRSQTAPCNSSLSLSAVHHNVCPTPLTLWKDVCVCVRKRQGAYDGVCLMWFLVWGVCIMLRNPPDHNINYTRHCINTLLHSTLYTLYPVHCQHQFNTRRKLAQYTQPRHLNSLWSLWRYQDTERRGQFSYLKRPRHVFTVRIIYMTYSIQWPCCCNTAETPTTA